MDSFSGQQRARAVAERAVITTLVTTEGRSLTEIRLTIKNQAQRS